MADELDAVFLVVNAKLGELREVRCRDDFGRVLVPRRMLHVLLFLPGFLCRGLDDVMEVWGGTESWTRRTDKGRRDAGTVVVDNVRVDADSRPCADA